MVTKVWAVVLTLMTYVVLADYVAAAGVEGLSFTDTYVENDRYTSNQVFTVTWDEAESVRQEPVPAVDSVVNKDQLSDSRTSIETIRVK